MRQARGTEGFSVYKEMRFSISLNRGWAPSFVTTEQVSSPSVVHLPFRLTLGLTREDHSSFCFSAMFYHQEGKITDGGVCSRATGLILPIHTSFIQTLWLCVFVSSWSIVGFYLSLIQWPWLTVTSETCVVVVKHGPRFDLLYFCFIVFLFSGHLA